MIVAANLLDMHASQFDGGGGNAFDRVSEQFAAQGFAGDDCVFAAQARLNDS